MRDARGTVRGPDRRLLRVSGAVARVRRGDRVGAVPWADPPPLPATEARAERLDGPLDRGRADRGAERGRARAPRRLGGADPAPLAATLGAGVQPSRRPGAPAGAAARLGMFAFAAPGRLDPPLGPCRPHRAGSAVAPRLSSPTDPGPEGPDRAAGR